MQVIAHRMNSLAQVRQALDWQCHFAEVDVWEQGGEFRMGRSAETALEPLAEALALPIGLYLDLKQGDPSRLAALLTARTSPTVVWAPSLELLRPLRPYALPQAGSQEELTLAIAALAPQQVAFDHRDFTPELITLAQNAGAKIFVDRFRENDNPWKWQEARDLGARAIQTDRPRELLQWLNR
jgi:glycerophosphoryl diester phosphodiesterase